MIRIRDPKNFACAGFFVAISAVLAHSALALPIGTASEMGPGYFPLALAVLLGGLGALLAVTSLRLDGAPVSNFEWRGFVLITLAIIAFGASIQRLGFVPAVVITVGLSTLASRRFTRRSAILLTAILLAFCWAVFVWGLGLPVRLFGA